MAPGGLTNPLLNCEGMVQISQIINPQERFKCDKVAEMSYEIFGFYLFTRKLSTFRTMQIEGNVRNFRVYSMVKL